MAIDTASKRRAAAAISTGYFAGPGATPSVTKDQAWRQSAGFGYPGIEAGQVVVVVIRQAVTLTRRLTASADLTRNLTVAVDLEQRLRQSVDLERGGDA